MIKKNEFNTFLQYLAAILAPLLQTSCFFNPKLKLSFALHFVHLQDLRARRKYYRMVSTTLLFHDNGIVPVFLSRVGNA